MNLLLIILIVLLVVGVPGGWRYGGPYLGGGVGLVVLILIILALSGRLRGRHAEPGLDRERLPPAGSPVVSNWSAYHVCPPWCRAADRQVRVRILKR
jgi:hypothetical protein